MTDMDYFHSKAPFVRSTLSEGALITVRDAFSDKIIAIAYNMKEIVKQMKEYFNARRI